MGEPIVKDVGILGRSDLCDLSQPAKRRGIQYPVSIALRRRPRISFGVLGKSVAATIPNVTYITIVNHAYRSAAPN